MADFTPTSGVVWTQNHGFAMGMEVRFTSQDTAERTVPIPYSITALEIFGGSLAYMAMPDAGDPLSAALFRIAIIGDPAGGDGGLGPGSVLILNQVLNINAGVPCVLPIMPFKIQLDNGRLPVPPDGSPYQLKVHIDAAGEHWPTDAEIELCGMFWT